MRLAEVSWVVAILLASGFAPLLPAAEPIPYGVTRQGTPILVHEAANFLALDSKKCRLLLVGIDGSPEATTAVRDALQWFETSAAAQEWRSQFSISAIPCANPDGLAAKTPGKNASGGHPAQGYPPSKGFYDHPTDPEAAYLWRWIGMHGADVVIVVRTGDKLGYSFHGPEAFTKALRLRFSAHHFDAPADDLAVQLAVVPACDVGTIPAVAIATPGDAGSKFLPALLAALSEARLLDRSPAHQELIRRQQRTTGQVAKELSRVYGQQLKQVAYIPALALVGRLRLGEIQHEPSHRKDVEQIVRPYFDGSQKPVPKNGSEHAGRLIFSELAHRTRGQEREQYIALCRLAADQIFDQQGEPLPIMPFHHEMSDAVFMAGPILAATGHLTGEARYFDACATHLASMRKLCLRSDGIYRNSPLDDAAWGRGNGFPALGMAWVLSEFPDDHPARPELLKQFQQHLAALLKHQDTYGCWHQVIDRPESYREFTATCMIGWAMLRGIEKGWLDKATYQPAVDRAWQAIKLRIGPEGKLVDVCTGTGKQTSLRGYYDRPAILGRDDRGGAMGLMFATALLAAEQNQPAGK